MLIKENVKKYDKIHREMLIKGFEERKIMPYPNAVFDYLRPYSVGGLPASIKLFTIDLCNGYCYDSALLMQLAFKNCQVVHADIESLRQIYSDENEWEHAFVEVTEEDGKEYVIDTSIGLIYDKDCYYEIEKPKINRAFSKSECMDNWTIKQILASNFEEDKYILPLVLPHIEKIIDEARNIGTSVYQSKLKEEIKLLKEAINYDAFVAEIKDDMRLMHENPKALDKKFSIVRDKYHNEVSKGGVKNVYYTSPRELDYIQSIQNDNRKREAYRLKLAKRNLKIQKREDAKVLKLASKRLEQILKNPTQNVYESE